MEERYKLYQGDCLEVMDKLIEEGVKVDLTVTSPPYDDLRNYNNSLAWNFDIFKQVADRLYKITKDGGVVVWVVGDKTKNGSETGTSFKQALYFKQIGFNLHDTMIYAKLNPVPLNHKRYEQQFEYMFILTKKKIKTFNGLRESCKNAGLKKTESSRQFRKDASGVFKTGNLNSVKNTKLRTNIWYYHVGMNGTSADKFAFKHPAMFPEKLAEDHILSWSNENDLVFDCFMGANTTGKMALLNNRRFIGIEKVEEYFDIAKQRIENIINK
jgi:site-specific DNA-methyltransferase (adenine-specific)|nr:MAG TPA: adenine-specific methyltransferase [Caudoviricetes sp.]